MKKKDVLLTRKGPLYLAALNARPSYSWGQGGQSPPRFLLEYENICQQKTFLNILDTFYVKSLKEN